MSHTHFVLASAIKELNEFGELCPETTEKLEKTGDKSVLAVGDLKKDWWFGVSTEELEFLEFVLENIIDPSSVNIRNDKKEIRDNLLRRIKRLEELSNAAIDED